MIEGYVSKVSALQYDDIKKDSYVFITIITAKNGIMWIKDYANMQYSSTFEKGDKLQIIAYNLLNRKRNKHKPAVAEVHTKGAFTLIKKQKPKNFNFGYN